MCCLGCVVLVCFVQFALFHFLLLFRVVSCYGCVCVVDVSVPFSFVSCCLVACAFRFVCFVLLLCVAFVFVLICVGVCVLLVYVSV